MNSGAGTCYNIQDGGITSIDLTLCSPSICHLINWYPSEHLYSSDHFPIIMDFPYMKLQNLPRFQNWVISKADWEIFQESVKLDISGLNNVQEINTAITQSILTAANASIPKLSGSFNKHQVPWWNGDCERAVHDKNRALSKSRRHPTYENLIAFKKARAIAKHTVKEGKTKSWQNFISSINSKTPSSVFWKQIKKIENKFNFNALSTIRNKEGEIENDPYKIANLFGDYFYDVSKLDYNISVATDYNSSNLSNSSNGNINNLDYNSPITENELLTSIKHTKSSAAGPDQIHIDMIKHLNSAQLNCILVLFNHIFCSQTLPKDWHLAHVIPTPKPSKDPLVYKQLSSNITNLRFK